MLPEGQSVCHCLHFQGLSTIVQSRQKRKKVVMVVCTLHDDDDKIDESRRDAL